MSAWNSPPDFRVLAELPELIAVDKPAGLLVHPTKPGGPRTLWDGARELLAYELANGGHLAILNRLDRETSGVVVVAKTLRAARECVRCMERREASKEYEAICFGWPVDDTFEVDLPILRKGEVEDSKVWLLRMAHPSGQPAQTVFRVLDRFSGTDRTRFCRVRAFPKTGRTHQIRVHLAAAGYPVVGDKLYAKGEEWYLRFIENGWTAEHRLALRFPRHLLHATRLCFPFDGGIEFCSPPDCLDEAARELCGR